MNRIAVTACLLAVASAGALGVIPAGMHHYAWSPGRTVIQLHGMGPWKLTYVNPADAPKPR